MASLNPSSSKTSKYQFHSLVDYFDNEDFLSGSHTQREQQSSSLSLSFLFPPSRSFSSIPSFNLCLKISSPNVQEFNSLNYSWIFEEALLLQSLLIILNLLLKCKKLIVMRTLEPQICSSCLNPYFKLQEKGHSHP